MSIAKSLLLLTAAVGALGLLIIAIVYQNPACAFGAVTSWFICGGVWR